MIRVKYNNFKTEEYTDKYRFEEINYEAAPFSSGFFNRSVISTLALNRDPETGLVARWWTERRGNEIS